MKIFIGSDHAGFRLKNELIKSLQQNNGLHTADITNCGCFSEDSCDYPDIARETCLKVLDFGDDALGVLVCGTGAGMSIAANKIRGIRATATENTYTARMTRLHNNANVLCIGARVVGVGLAEDILKAFLSTQFEGGRHSARVAKLEGADA
ncbi:MAG: ribose 5-phosphate isomerase B [Clostridiales bacterium]|jgi:ribose 5-phosphate isomerase B|nr:ribose 5-phosphate isomerase B [Clostridiales bacterium]